MKFGRRELIMSALVAALGAAVYLNWQFGANGIAAETNKNEDELGVAHYVNAAISTSDKAEKKTNKTSSSSVSCVNSHSTQADDYFSKVRLERRQTQDEMIDLARSIVEATETSGKGREEAVKQLNDLSNIIQQQGNIENLVKAKGFKDCVAFIQNGECSVVVTGLELKSDLLIAIKDIVMGQSGIDFDRIRVTEI